MVEQAPPYHFFDYVGLRLLRPDGLTMTPHQITAKAYPSVTLRTSFVQGKHGFPPEFIPYYDVGAGMTLRIGQFESPLLSTAIKSSYVKRVRALRI